MKVKQNKEDKSISLIFETDEDLVRHMRDNSLDGDDGNRVKVTFNQFKSGGEIRYYHE